MIEAEVEDYFRQFGYRPKQMPWNRMSGKLFKESQVGGMYNVEPLFRESVLDSFEMRIAMTGSKLEEHQMELSETLNQIEETKKTLQQSFNELVKLSHALFPLVKEQIEALRSTRMALQTESRATLQSLEDVRHFFLDHDYEREMKRIESFVSLCREFQELKTSGVLDDIVDLSIKMALREDKK